MEHIQLSLYRVETRLMGHPQSRQKNYDIYDLFIEGVTATRSRRWWRGVFTFRNKVLCKIVIGHEDPVSATQIYSEEMHIRRKRREQKDYMDSILCDIK